MKKHEFESLWDSIKVWLADATDAAIKEAEDLSRRGRLKMDLLRISRETEKRLARLGSIVYGRFSKEPDAPFAPNEESRKLVREVARLEAELREHQQQYDAERRR